MPDRRAATLSSEPEAGPALLRRIAGRQEQHGLAARVAARDHQEPGVLRLELGEIEERVVLPEVVVLDVVALELALVRRGDQHHAAAESGEQGAAPRGDRGGVDGAPHAGELGHGRPRAERRAIRVRASLRRRGAAERADDDEQQERSHGHRSYRARCDAAT